MHKPSRNPGHTTEEAKPSFRKRSLERLFWLLLTGGALLGALLFAGRAAAQQPTAATDEDLRQALKDIRGKDLKGKDGPLAKIGTDLVLLYRSYTEHKKRDRTAATYRAPGRIGSAVRVQEAHVTIDAIATADRGGEALLRDLRKKGLKNGSQAGRLVSGRLPIGRLEEVAALSSMHSARPAAAATTDGKAVNQGGPAMLSDDVRASQDLDGGGVTVGVLSDTYNKADASTTAQNDIGSGDLPPSSKIDILDDSPSSGSDEGRAMMQIIHDVAPGASQAFHTAFGGRANFAEGIQDLADAGADVIVDDIIYFAEPMFQAGAIAQAVDRVNGQGVAYFSSAGNNARQSYSSSYEETDTGAFEFDSVSGDTTQSVTSSGEVTLSFQWDDPYASASTGDVGADTDLDIFLLNENGNLVGSSERDNVGGDPVELLTIPGSGNYQIYIKRASGPPPSSVKYVYFGDLRIEEYGTQSPSSYGHANTSGAIAVGAAYYRDTPEFGTVPPLPEGFSSTGGVPILFDKDGSRKSSPLVREKPDITAPDGVNTTFFGQLDTDGDGFPNFFGTSAAAPNAAAVAALQIDADPGLGPAAVLSGQQSSAIDMEDPGFDKKTGAGLLQAPEAVGTSSRGSDLAVSVLSISPSNPSANEEVRHVATVCNEGGRRAGASTLEFAVAGEPSPETFSISALDPSHCESVERKLQLTAGEYQNRATADVNGAVSEASENNNEETLTYQVQTVSEPPTAAGDSAQTVGEEPVTTEVLSNDSDPEGSLEKSSVEVESKPSSGTATANSDGTVTYDPDSGFVGTDSYSYTVADTAGTRSNEATVTIEVLPENTPPVANADSFETTQDSVLAVSPPGVLGNDTDANGDTLSTALVSRVGNGDLTLDSDGSFEYVPNPGFSGTDSFTYRAVDDSTAADTASVKLTVLPIGEALAGSVNYPVVQNSDLAGSRALEGVEVRASSSDTTVTDTTGADGTYRLTGLPAGDYTAVADVAGSSGNISAMDEVNATDALRTVLGFIGIVPFAGDFQKEIADVNGDGVANATDALQIARFSVGAIAGFQAGSFFSSSSEVTIGAEDASGVMLRTAMYGDVDLSGGQGNGGTSNEALEMPALSVSTSPSLTKAAFSSRSRRTSQNGRSFEVPVRMNGSGKVGAYSLTLMYDTEKASFEGARQASSDPTDRAKTERSKGAMNGSGGVVDNPGSVMSNAKDGTVRVSWFDRTGEQPIDLEDGAKLVMLRFSTASDVEEGTSFQPEVTDGELSGTSAQPLAGTGVEVSHFHLDSTIPEEFVLKGNAPNPVSSGQTEIVMNVPERTTVTVEIFNTLGQRVVRTKSEVPAGRGQSVQIDGKGLASGKYFYRVSTRISGAEATGETPVRKTGRLTVVK